MPRPNTDTFGSQDPEWIARCRADVAEYESYLPKYDRCNGGTGSTRVNNPKKVKSTMTRKNQPARALEEVA